MSTREINTVIFDCDGVIVDSVGLQIKTEQEQAIALAHDNGRKFDVAEHDWSTLRGLNRRVIAARLFGVDAESDLAREYRNRVVEQMVTEASPETTPLIEGIKAFMSYVVMRGCKIGVATSSTRQIFDQYLDVLDLDQINPDYTIASHEAGPNKPSPGPYLEIMSRLHAEPSRTLVIDDSIPGIDGGRFAGAWVIAPETTHSRDYLLEHSGAQLIVSSYQEAAILLQPYLP